MDAHIWQAIYPGLLVGLLYGVSGGGIRNISLGAIGGMTGAMLAFFAVFVLAIPNGLISVAISLILSARVAFGLIRVAGAPSGPIDRGSN